MTTLLPRGTGPRTAQSAPGSRPGARPSAPPAGRRPTAPVPPAPLASAPRGRPRLPFAALILLLLGGGLCALLALNTASAAGEVQERELADQARTLGDTEQDLRREVAALEAPAALASAAAGLGMVPGRNPAFLVIAPDGSVSVLGDPRAAPLPVPPPDPNATPTATPAATPDPSATPAPIPDPNATPAPAPSAGTTPTPDPAATPTPSPEPTVVATPVVPTTPPAGQ